MNWSLAIIIVCSPTALYFLLVGVVGIWSGLKLPDGHQQNARILGGLIFLFFGIVFAALTIGAIFK